MQARRFWHTMWSWLMVLGILTGAALLLAFWERLPGPVEAILARHHWPAVVYFALCVARVAVDHKSLSRQSPLTEPSFLFMPAPLRFALEVVGGSTLVYGSMVAIHRLAFSGAYASAIGGTERWAVVIVLVYILASLFATAGIATFRALVTRGSVELQIDCPVPDDADAR